MTMLHLPRRDRDADHLPPALSERFELALPEAEIRYSIGASVRAVSSIVMCPQGSLLTDFARPTVRRCDTFPPAHSF